MSQNNGFVCCIFLSPSIVAVQLEGNAMERKEIFSFFKGRGKK